MIAAYPDNNGCVGQADHADAEDDALLSATMQAEGIMREAETIASYFDGRREDIALAPRARTAGSVAEAERLLALTGEAAQAVERLRCAIFGKRV